MIAYNSFYVKAISLLIFGAFISASSLKAQPLSNKASLHDKVASFQRALQDPNQNTVLINSVITVDEDITIPANKVLRFDAGGKLAGRGSINGGIVEASYHQQIFDTGFNIHPTAVAQYFSAKWFGATGTNNDDYAAIQKAINTCIKNNIRVLFIPAGRYKISKPLIVQGIAENKRGMASRWFCTLEILGESSFWDNNMGTEIYPDFKNSFAIGIQTGKGCKISKLKIAGSFKPPHSADRKKFFSTSFEDFTDGACRDSRYSPYAAIVIDPFTNLTSDGIPADGGYPGLTEYYGKANNMQSLSGSTATELEELSISGFVVGICSSPNGVSKNAEITIINKVQFENCKLAISGGQAQEKMNRISNIACWGGTHTIFATGLYGSPKEAGNWYIDHINIAGGVSRFIYNEQKGYFPIYITAVYAESLGSWGTINSDVATEISNCVIDFEDPGIAGDQNLLTSWGTNIVYRNCNFRFYGTKHPLKMTGNCVFDNCFFSGKLVMSSNSTFDLKHVTTDPLDKRSLVSIIIIISVIAFLVVVILLYFLLKQKRKLRKSIN